MRKYEQREIPSSELKKLVEEGVIHGCFYIPGRIATPRELENLDERVRTRGEIVEPVILNKCKCGKGGFDVIEGTHRIELALKYGLPIKVLVYDVSRAEAQEIARATEKKMPLLDIDRCLRIKARVDELTEFFGDRSKAINRIAEEEKISKKRIYNILKIVENPSYSKIRKYVVSPARIAYASKLTIDDLYYLIQISNERDLFFALDKVLFHNWTPDDVKTFKDLKEEEARKGGDH